MQIRDIILYGPEEEPRVLRLAPGRMNIITGSSKTGKSALIAIVDYCLGSSDCGVAYGPIRSTVEWYALRLTLGSQEILVARKAPAKGQDTSSAVYLEIAETVDIPRRSSLSQTTNVGTAVELLSRATGIADNLNEPTAGQTRDALAATIKHALYFCFQPQDEIISRKNLFYQQGEPFIPQAIKDVLPYFLGAISDDHVVKAGRLRDLRRDLKLLLRKLAEAEAMRGQGSARAAALLSEARDLGLISSPSPGLAFDEAVGLLREVLEGRVPTRPGFDPTVPAVGYEALIEQREQVTRLLRRSDADLRGARALIAERQGYTREGAEHVARLSSIGILPKVDVAGHTCPLCSSELPHLPGDSSLRTALEAIEQRLESVDHDNPHLERLVRQLEEQVRNHQRDLADNRQAMEALQRSQRQLAEYRDLVGRWGHVRGRISIFLEAVPEATPALKDVDQQVKALSREITELEAELGDEAVEERVQSILSVLSSYITESGRALKLEHSEHPLRFNVKKLTVVADTPTGPVPMDKMGSGANWVGYHIATHLALHRVFTEAGRPVPRFLFLDQPSQVYFPADRDIRGRLEVAREGRPADEDRLAVLEMFKLVHDVVSSLGGGLQVIITEHADPDADWYQDAVVERWRDGAALIPQAWIDAHGG